jgi:hypothetical protein
MIDVCAVHRSARRTEYVHTEPLGNDHEVGREGGHNQVVGGKSGRPTLGQIRVLTRTMKKVTKLVGTADAPSCATGPAA